MEERISEKLKEDIERTTAQMLKMAKDIDEKQMPEKSKNDFKKILLKYYKKDLAFLQKLLKKTIKYENKNCL